MTTSTKFFRFPWATSGDKATIPDAVQVDGSASYPEGFGAAYELELGVDAGALPVPRDESNQLYFDITSNLRAWQLAGLPEWVPASQNDGVAVTYPKSAMVRHNQSGSYLAYFANVETTAEPGTSADWTVPPIDTATIAEIRAGIVEKGVRVDRLWGAGGMVALTDAATIALDLSAGVNFSVTLGGNRVLGNPSSPKVGQMGMIVVTQGGTGNRTLSFGANWVFSRGVVPAVSPAAASISVINYEVLSATKILGVMNKAVS